MTLKEYFDKYKNITNKALKDNLPPSNAMPERLHSAIHYSLDAGGKRLRPILFFTVYMLEKDNIEPVLPFAAGIEMIHTHSLIHDDLPAMDNDDLRRGKPTVHKAYDEATAILAGDALIISAFQSFTRCNVDAKLLIKAINIMTESVGSQGIIGGQMVDIMYEGKELDKDILYYIHKHKTAKFFEGVMHSAAVLSNMKEENIILFKEAGLHLGIAFQIIDDILDIKSDVKTLGKTPGKDVATGKQTYPALYGLDNSYKKAEEEIQIAFDYVDKSGYDVRRIKEMGTFFKERMY